MPSLSFHCQILYEENVHFPPFPSAQSKNNNDFQIPPFPLPLCTEIPPPFRNLMVLMGGRAGGLRAAREGQVRRFSKPKPKPYQANVSNKEGVTKLEDFKARAENALKKKRADRGMVDGRDVKAPGKDKVFKKGTFDMGKGGLAAYDIDNPALLEQVKGSVGESIDFSEHAQDVFKEFTGANEADWEECYDLILNRDTYNRFYLADWTARGMGLFDFF